MSYHFLPKYGGTLLEPYHRQDVPDEHREKFTFTIVRNPYDRLISCWHYCCRIQELDRHNLKDLGPAGFARWSTGWATPNRPGFLNQDEFLSRARIDYVIRFENLEAGLRKLPFVNGDFSMPGML